MNSGKSIRSIFVTSLSCLVGALVLLSPWTLAWADNVLVFPQLVAGGSYISFVSLMDTDFNTAVSGTLFVYNPDGSPRSIAIDGQPTGSQFQVNIPPGGNVVLSTTAGGNLTVGMAKFVSNIPAGGVIRFQFPGGQVGVLNSIRQLFATIPLTTNNGNDTGIAIANAGSSPVNIRLAYADGNGNVVQTVDPPTLNPLPANGQVAMFAEQFGLTQAANQSTGSIQIETKGAGGFNALGLLLNGGLLSTTAVVAGVTGMIDPTQFEGSYTGSFHNASTGTDSVASAFIAVVRSISAMIFVLSSDSTVFHATGTIELLFFGNYGSGPFTLTGSNGGGADTYTTTINPDGTMSLSGSFTRPQDTITSLNCNGQAHPEQITGNCVAMLKDGTSNNLTMTLNHTNQ